LTRIRTVVVALAIALLIPAAIAGCGGSSDNNEDPQQVLDETFNNPTKITSGKLDVSVDGSAEGDQSGSFSASISGPFQTDPNDETAFPQLDLTANVSGSAGGPSISFDGSLIATEDNAYVEYQDQAYEVGTAAFQQFSQAYAKSAKQNQAQGDSSVFSRFGVDPKNWFTNVTNEGTTDVEGTESIQIHGDADLPRLVSDLQKISKATGNSTAQQLTPDQIDQLQSSVKDASIDVYSSTDDHLLTKLAASLSITPPAGTGATVSSVDVDFAVTLSDLNEPQTISAPSNAKPIAELLGQLGIPGLSGGSTGGFDIPGAGSSGSAGSSALEKCIAQASTSADTQKCFQKAS
jgi:hypothetical protein